MIWKLMHKLFGIHYVMLPWGFADTDILMVRTLKVTGEKYVVLFGGWHFLKPDGTTDTGRKYKPLTWRLEDVNNTKEIS